MTAKSELIERLRVDADCVRSPVLTNWPDPAFPMAIATDMLDAIDALTADAAEIERLTRERDEALDLLAMSHKAQAVEREHIRATMAEGKLADAEAKLAAQSTAIEAAVEALEDDVEGVTFDHYSERQRLVRISKALAQLRPLIAGKDAR